MDPAVLLLRSVQADTVNEERMDNKGFRSVRRAKWVRRFKIPIGLTSMIKFKFLSTNSKNLKKICFTKIKYWKHFFFGGDAGQS